MPELNEIESFSSLVEEAKPTEVAAEESSPSPAGQGNEESENNTAATVIVEKSASGHDGGDDPLWKDSSLRRDSQIYATTKQQQQQEEEEGDTTGTSPQENNITTSEANEAVKSSTIKRTSTLQKEGHDTTRTSTINRDNNRSPTIKRRESSSPAAETETAEYNDSNGQDNLLLSNVVQEPLSMDDTDPHHHDGGADDDDDEKNNDKFFNDAKSTKSAAATLKKGATTTKSSKPSVSVKAVVAAKNGGVPSSPIKHPGKPTAAAASKTTSSNTFAKPVVVGKNSSNTAKNAGFSPTQLPPPIKPIIKNSKSSQSSPVKGKGHTSVPLKTIAKKPTEYSNKSPAAPPKPKPAQHKPNSVSFEVSPETKPHIVMASFSGARSNATELENEDSNSSKSISLDIIKENEESGYATSLLNGKDNDDDQARHYRASSDKSHDGNSRRGSSMPKNPEPTEAEKRRRASSNDASNQRLKHLETENGELKKQVSILKRRLLKDLSKSTYLTNTIFSKIPTSVQANLNLRYQFKKKIESERVTYLELQEENKFLSSKIKELQVKLMKKVLDNDKRGPKVNEVLYWKSRFKESEKEKGKVLETLNSTVRKLESETKSNDLLRKQLSIVHIHNARIPDILADLTADIKNNADLNSHMRKNSVRVRAKTSPNSSGVYDNNETVSRAPRTAATVAEQNRTNTRAKADLDASLNKSSSKTRPTKVGSVVAESGLNTSHTRSKSVDNHDLPPKSADNDHSMVIEVDQLGSTDLPPLPAKPIDDGTIKKKNSMISSNGTLNGVPMPDDEERRLRLAKVQVEYDVYVKNSR